MYVVGSKLMIYIHIHLLNKKYINKIDRYIDRNELKATIHIKQSSSNELSTPVSINIKCKQTKVDTKCIIFLS